VNLGITVRALGDLPRARALQEQALESFSRTHPESQPDLQIARCQLGITLRGLGDLPGARRLQEAAVEGISKIVPEDHGMLLWARSSLADTLRELGDLAKARELQESVLAVRERTLREDDLSLLAGRLNLSATLYELGDLRAARALQERVLEAYVRILPEDHPDRLAAQGNLANTLKALGDFRGALAIEELALAVRSRILPPDHPDLAFAKGNLAMTLKGLGDLHRAKQLEEEVLALRTRDFPEDHPHLQIARTNLSLTRRALGDLVGARELQEKVLEVSARTLPADHPGLQSARSNLAATLETLGELPAARALAERALEVQLRTLPADHPELQRTRVTLANVLSDLGDLHAARALQEQVLEVWSRTLPEDHSDLQGARGILGVTLYKLGDFEAARALQEKALEVYERIFPEDHPDLQILRGNLALTLRKMGDFRGSRELSERVLAVHERTLPPGHPFIQAARQNVAITLEDLGEFRLARELHESALEELERAFPGGRPGVGCYRHNLASALARTLDAANLQPLAAEFSRGLRAAVADAVVSGSSREAEERLANESKHVALSLSYSGWLASRGAEDSGAEDALALVEMTRGAGIAAAALRAALRGDPEARSSFERAARASNEIARIARAAAGGDALAEAVRERDDAQRAVAALLSTRKEIASLFVEPRPEALARRLGPDGAAIGYWRYPRTTWVEGGEGEAREAQEERLLAHVVRGDGSFSRVELGPIGPIERAVTAWRASLGASEESVALARGVSASVPGVRGDDAERRGRDLAALVFDPLRGPLGNAKRLVCALDDVLHLVPLDALPAEEASGTGGQPARLGDRFAIETRVSLAELLGRPAMTAGERDLLVLGGVDYGAAPATDAATALESQELPSRGQRGPAILRGGAWSAGFVDLPATDEEARSIAREFSHRGGDGEARLFAGADATRQNLLEFAPRSRFLHIATHGWFAPESIPSWKGEEPLDRHADLGSRLSGAEQIRGMSPMLLCGLALAGANVPEDDLGRASGLVTAEELSALDLTHCELAVLSACDTNVGERRAGQGVASLQQALQMAGARSVITSLWKVPDEATRELMTDFYRRIWVGKESKRQALWEAKRKLREAVDETGRSLYSTRDWAAWVLTGDPE